jgi:hypothetical protein
VGGGKSARLLLFWLADGKLTPAYDEEAIAAGLDGGYFSCYGVDGDGNFAGSSGGHVVTVAPDGKTVKHEIKVPISIQWGIYPDRKTEAWFVKGMDHYSITRVTPDGKCSTLMTDGTWKVHGKDTSSRGYNAGGFLCWMWGLPLQDGRYVGWNSHGALPVFVGQWLQEN